MDLERLQNENAGDRLRFFTSLELAEILKMHPQVITRKLQAGEIAGYKLGKDWRVSEAQLMEFLERHSNSRARRSSAQLAKNLTAAPVSGEDTEANFNPC